MTLCLLNTVIDFLKQNPGQKYTAREIATWISSNCPDECQRKRERSIAKIRPLDSDGALIQQIAAEIGSQFQRMQKREPLIKTTEGSPRKYFFTKTIDNAEMQCSGKKNFSNIKMREQDMYPLLIQFLWSEFAIYSKRINDKRSSNSRGSNGNIWLYPDLVGMEDLSNDWHREIRDCVQQYADKKTRLWSFEAKILINRSNVRETFFQTVSNSSWANLSYLVATEIDGPDTLKELRLLSGLHGVGVIRFDINNISERQIMIPAKERPDVDWNIANRLIYENSDFLEYISLVRRFYQTGDVRPSDWNINDS